MMPAALAPCNSRRADLERCRCPAVYPNYIPMHPAAVRAMQSLLVGYRFADVYGHTWGRNILGDGRAAVHRSFARYFRAVGAAA